METEAFEIIVDIHGMQRLQVQDYADGADRPCKFEVFDNGKLMLSLEPDSGSFKVFSNPDNINEKVVDKVICAIEGHYL
jgi:hypothetical protein